MRINYVPSYVEKGETSFFVAMSLISRREILVISKLILMQVRFSGQAFLGFLDISQL
jgi:hypothetical protein